MIWAKLIGWFAPYLIPAAGAVVVFALLFGGAQTWRLGRAQAALDRAQAVHLKEIGELKDTAIKAAAENARETARRLAKYQEAQDASEIRAQKYRADAVVAGSALERLQQRAASAVDASCGAASGNPAGGAEEGATPGGVCSELLGRLGDAARRIGQFADESDNDDQTCRASAGALAK